MFKILPEVKKNESLKIDKILDEVIISDIINKKTGEVLIEKDTIISKNINLYLDSIIAPSALNEKFLEALELILFKGYGHYKRGQGITTIAWNKFKDGLKKIWSGLTDKIMELKKSVVEILQEDDIEQNLNLFEL